MTPNEWIYAAIGFVTLCGLVAAIAERTSERDEARDAFAHEAEQNVALVAECERLHLELTEAQLLAGKTPRALRIVEQPVRFFGPNVASPDGPARVVSMPVQPNADDAWWDRLYGNKDGRR